MILNTFGEPHHIFNKPHNKLKNELSMKKLLLPILMLLLSMTAGAQTRALGENQEYLAAHGKISDTTGDATKIQGYDEYYDFYHNTYGMDFDAVFARFTKEDLEKYIGYKVVGISVAGEFGQANVDFMLNIQCNQTFGDQVKMSSKNVAIAKQAKATPSVNGMKLYNWNDIMFDTPYIIPAKKENAEEGDPDDFQDIYVGYWIKNTAGKMVMDQLLVAQNYSDNEEDAGTYVQQTGASTKIPRIAGMFPGLLPVKLILEKPSSTGGDTPEGDKEYLTAHGKTSDTTGDATKIQGYDEYYDFYHNSYGMDFDAVFARFSTDDLEQYIGYKVVGLSVAGEFGQSNVDFMLNIQCNQTFGDQVKMSSKNVAIAKQAKATPSVNGMKLYNWNDIMFDTPYTIPAKKEDATDGDPDNFQDLYAGYWIKDANGKMVMDQLLVGQNYSDNEEDAGTYVQQTGASTKIPRIAGMFPGLLPVKLILEKGSSAGISGTETKADAKEVARYSLNGTRIYVPVRGINIVKMSDGTTRKVMVNK